MIDFEPYRRGEKTLPEIAAGLSRADLGTLTDEMCALQLQLVSDIEDADVVFVPDDPEANDTFAATPDEVGISWTLGHVIVHTTASSEEAAANALNLARGVEVLGHSRSEGSMAKRAYRGAGSGATRREPPDAPGDAGGLAGSAKPRFDLHRQGRSTATQRNRAIYRRALS